MPKMTRQNSCSALDSLKHTFLHSSSNRSPDWKTLNDPIMAQSLKVDDLPIEQLGQLNKQVDQEIEFFNASINELRNVEKKFAQAEEAIKNLAAHDKKETFVPLSESMYIRGQVTDTKTYMVDIGTGYYVRMNEEKAQQYFQRKQEFLQKQINQLSEILPQKKKTKALLVGALQQKVAMFSQQTAPAAK